VAVSHDGISSVNYYQVAMDPAVYVNNIPLINTISSSTPMGTNTEALMIGGRQNSIFPYWFNGNIEEIVLFNKVLTQTEIQSVYDYLWGIVKITTVSSNSLVAGQNFTVSYSVNNTSFFSSTNTFTVQLSNASGSFALPLNIGSVTTTSGGMINCTIPHGFVAGTGYRVRIVASDVPYTTNDNGVNISISTVGVRDVNSGDDIKLYPNPNKGIFTISGNFTNREAVTLEVQNIIGQVIYRDKATVKNSIINKEISLGANMPAGVYMLKLTSGDVYKTIRFSIEK
jgi:hypothetical protein